LAESPTPAAKAEEPLGAEWRSAIARTQRAALPSGRLTVSCPAPLGAGGLGRHLQEIIGALSERDQEAVCICEGADLPPPRSRRPRLLAPALSAPLLRGARFWPPLRMWLASVQFDADAARRLAPADHLIAFNGTALAQFQAARGAGYRSLGLASANSHIRRVLRQHAAAHRRYPLERPWATWLLRRNLVEYARADRIYVSTEYARESFVEQGIGDERLARFPLSPHSRYHRDLRPPQRSTFDVVYVGSLLVHKGVPLLVEAVRRLPYADMRLVLVGGWASRGMRRFIEQARAADARITVSVGDPLPHLRGARLFAHPAYEDGFGYAPAEALACGVPVLVSQDTGMKELIDSDRSGLVLPTGDLDALTAAIEAAYRGEIFNG
jgi:glycosyltransferase involved in cell wall biosynthesis